MRVIPVLDIKDQLVVLASGGQRERYRPLATALVDDPHPPAVVRAMLGLFEFDTFYIADLDAIEEQRPNLATTLGLAAEFPSIEFWLDPGIRSAADFEHYAGAANIRLVVGSESLDSIAHYQRLCTHERLRRHILSLDRKNGAELGPTSLIARGDVWPDTVISMDLESVGRDTGPNLERIAKLRMQNPTAAFVAAGGIRNAADLRSLAAHQVYAALVATALHRRRISSGDLRALAELSA